MNLLLKLIPYLLRFIEAKPSTRQAPFALPSGSDPTDPRAWADAWAREYKIEGGEVCDESAMIAWFARAIMAGYEAGCAFTLAYPASEAAASVPTMAVPPMMVLDNGTVRELIPCVALCESCRYEFATCKGYGQVFACDVPCLSQGPHDDRVVSCNIYKAKRKEI